MMNSRITADIQGYEGLRFWKMSGREAISESFTWTVILLGEEGRLDRSHFLGKSLCHDTGTKSSYSSLPER